MTYYENHHYSQYDAAIPIVRSQGCTPTTGSNGADASTGGRVKISPDAMWRLIPENEQTNPRTPGWSLVDLDRAMAKVSVPFTNRSGRGWTDVLNFIHNGYYVALQGDCDQLPGGCSGFMGDHCLGISPIVTDKGQRCDEPTRRTHNYYSLSQLRNYAIKFSGSARKIYFGTFDNPVPQTEDTMGVNAVPDGPTVAGIYRCDITAQTIPANGDPRGQLVAGAIRHALGVWLLTDLDNRRCYAISEDDELAYVAEANGTFTPMDPASNDLAARQEQWDKDASAIIGSRPTT